jgi:hypothetical protein
VRTPGDDWVWESFQTPIGTNTTTTPASFETLSAKSAGSRLVVSWQAGGTNEMAASVWFSHGGAGHWLSRDWSRRSAELHGNEWSTVLPVVDLDEPILYFAAAVVIGGTTNVSQGRICRPRDANLPAPTVPRSMFLEGFEEGSWNWRSTDERADVRRSEGGRQSGHSLVLEIPAGQRSASVATTRIQGNARTGGATGFAIWMRSGVAHGQVRLMAVSDVGTERQATAAFPSQVAPGAEWGRHVFRFEELKNFPIGALDRVVVEFSASGPATLWLDDLELVDF